MDIETLQHDFIEAIFGGDKAPAASHVIGDDKLTAEERFGIYSGSVHGILTQALGLTFPVCKALVGDVFYNNMCKIFIDAHPPTTSYFVEYGNQMPQFLSSFEHVKDIPYIVDVARLEWARHEVWHQKIVAPIDFSNLASLTEEEQPKVIFKLLKTMRLIKSDYRIDELWLAHQEDADKSLESIDLNTAVKLFISKDQESIKISSMSETEEDSVFWDFIKAVSEENTLDVLAEKFGESLPEHLNQAIQSGLIQSFKIKI